MDRIHFKDLKNYILVPISFYIKEFSADFYMTMHSHGYFEFMYANKGEFQIEILKNSSKIKNYQPDNNLDTNDKEILVVNQGEFIFLDSYVFHRLRIKKNNVSIYNVELEAKPVYEYNPFSMNSIFTINYENLITKTNLNKFAINKKGYVIIPDSSKVILAFRNLISALMSSDSSLEKSCEIQCRLLLFYLEISKSATPPPQKNIHYIKKILIFIKQNFNKKINLDDIAKQVELNKFYMSSQFKKYTGKTILETITAMRISKALQLLRDSSFPISEIAKLSGFTSYTQMCYEFNKTLKLSPNACRKSFLNDEIDYTNLLYNAVSIKVDDEDFLLNDKYFLNLF